MWDNNKDKRKEKKKRKKKKKEAKNLITNGKKKGPPLSLSPPLLLTPSLQKAASLAGTRQAPDEGVRSGGEEFGKRRRLQCAWAAARRGRVIGSRRLVLVLLRAAHPDLLVLALGLVLGVFELASSLGLRMRLVLGEVCKKRRRG